MLNLPVLQPGEIESPAQMFRCEFYKATIAAGICIARQKHRYRQRIGGGAKARSEMRVSKHLAHCASGECAQGNVIATRLKDFEPEDEEVARDRRRAEFTRSGQAKVAEVEQRLAQEKAEPGWDEFRAKKEAERAAEVDEPPRPPMKCKWEGGCNTALRVNNLSGLCQLHRNRVTSRQRVKLVPRLARAAGTAGNALDSEPAPPAEEKRMRASKLDQISDEDLRAAYAKAGSVSALRASLGVGTKPLRERVEKLGLLGRRSRPLPTTPAAPRSLEDVARKHAGAGDKPAADDVVSLLEERRAHHLDQAEKIGKALEALR